MNNVHNPIGQAEGASDAEATIQALGPAEIGPTAGSVTVTWALPAAVSVTAEPSVCAQW
jgi:hypothetical protein